MKSSIFLIAFLLLAAVPTAFGQSEKELVIKAAGAIQTSPMDSETKDMVKKAIKWVDETDQVTVGLCGGVVGSFLDKKYKNTDDLLSSYTLGMAAFKLQNPDKKSDEMAAQLIGVESVLKTYESILKLRPKAKSDAIDALIDKRNNGKLGEAVASIDCSKRL